MPSQKLKSCPFCSSKNIMAQGDDISNSMWTIWCLDCYVSLNRYDKKEAIKAWNTRSKDND